MRTVTVVAGVIAVAHTRTTTYHRGPGDDVACGPCVSIERVGRVRPTGTMSLQLRM